MFGLTLATLLTTSQCSLGAYRSPGGALVAITRPLPGTTISRYTLLSGQRGNTNAVDSPVRCVGDTFYGRDDSGTSFIWAHVPFRATSTKFKSEGVWLYGLLLEPENSAKKPPLVVFVHGSERTSDIGLYYQGLLTAQGVTTFFYDKRGTGLSSGSYTQDFIMLAKDAANAANAARRLAKGRFGRLGFFGGSQGGWVAPLAALTAHADFLEVGFGVVGTALEQDQWQVDYQLAMDGFGPDILPDVHRVTDATASVVGSDFANVNELSTIASRYSGEPWFKKIDGQYSGDLLHGKIKTVETDSTTLRVPWHYSGLTTLKQLTIPELWVFARDDSIAPSATSIKRLVVLQAGRKLSIAVFPGTDHGIRLFHVDAHGARDYGEGSVADGYLRLLADFAKGDVSGTYQADWVK